MQEEILHLLGLNYRQDTFQILLYSTYQSHSWDLDTIYGRAGHATICLAMRRCNNVIELEGQDKMSRSRCLNGVATANIDILQEPKMLWPKKTWSRCSVPSSYFWVVLRIWIQIKFCRIQNNNSDPENCGIFWPLTSLYSIFHHLL